MFTEYWGASCNAVYASPARRKLPSTRRENAIRFRKVAERWLYLRSPLQSPYDEPQHRYDVTGLFPTSLPGTDALCRRLELPEHDLARVPWWAAPGRLRHGAWAALSQLTWSAARARGRSQLLFKLGGRCR